MAGGCAPGEQMQSRPARSSVTAPVMQTQTLGYSVEGRPIVMHSFGGSTQTGTLIIAGIHGDEPTGITVAEELVRLLGRGGISDVEWPVAIIPIANPDGARRGRRTNARQVDINRNFPAGNWAKNRRGPYHGGAAPLSEPETLAIHDAVETLKPRRIISIHSITRGRHCNNFDGPGEELAIRMARHNGYPVKATIGYPTPGSFGSWAGGDLQIPVITLELPRDLPGDAAWEINREALLEALRRRA